MCFETDFPEMIRKLNLKLDRKSNHKKHFVNLECEQSILQFRNGTYVVERRMIAKTEGTKAIEEDTVQGLEIRVQQGYRKEKTLTN